MAKERGVQALKQPSMEVESKQLTSPELIASKMPTYKGKRHSIRLSNSAGSAEEKMVLIPKYGIFADIENHLDGYQRSSEMTTPDDVLGRPQKSRGHSVTFWKDGKQTTKKGEEEEEEDTLEHKEKWLCQRYPMDKVLSYRTDGARGARARLAKSLNEYSGDRLARIARLRHNVLFIEKKLCSMLKSSRASSRTVSRANSGVGTLMEDANILESLGKPTFTAAGQALKHFRAKARTVMIIIKWIRMMSDSDQSKLERELKTLIAECNDDDVDAEFNESMTKSGLKFDKTYFKANREISLSSDVKEILNTRPEFRTKEMLKQVFNGLETLEALAEYPLETQDALCKVAWFQRVEARKVILRQGHAPECFYFILSGIAWVKKMNEDPDTGAPTVVTVARLGRGKSFGELGLLFNQARAATVESATGMDLLVIGKADFYKIFIQPSSPEDEPTHVAFLRNLPLFKEWPLEALKLEPGAVLIHYFKRGTLITDNGKNSDWIYVVRSGTCEAIKRLRAVKPRNPRELRRSPNLMCDIILPQLGVAGPKINSGLLNGRKKVMVHTDVWDSMTSYYDGLRKALAQPPPEEKLHLPRINVKHDRESNGQSQDGSAPSEEIFMTNKVRFRLTTPLEKNKSKTLMRNPPPPPSRVARVGMSKSKFSCRRPFMSEAHMVVPSPEMLGQTMAPKRTPRRLLSESSDSSQTQVFVKLDLLTAKDIFGMNTMTFAEMVDEDDIEVPEVALVSRGAEVILFSKKTFYKYADEKVMVSFKECTKPYPRESTLQENLQVHADWQCYRHAVLHDFFNKDKVTRPKTSMV